MTSNTQSVTETHRIENLLKPRYEIIADYPGNSRPVGYVFIMDQLDAEGRWTTQGYLQEMFFTQYPHLFKFLQWWEKRKIEEMPEYVKCNRTPDQKIMPGDVVKIISWFAQDIGKGDAAICVMDTGCFEPATEREYNQFINSNNGK